MLKIKINNANFKTDIKYYAISSVIYNNDYVYFTLTTEYNLKTGDSIYINDILVSIIIDNNYTFHVLKNDILNEIDIITKYYKEINNSWKLIFRTQHLPRLISSGSVMYSYIIYENSERTCINCNQTLLHKIENINGINQHICPYCGYIDYNNEGEELVENDTTKESAITVINSDSCQSGYTEFYINNLILSGSTFGYTFDYTFGRKLELNKIYDINYKNSVVKKDSTGFNIQLPIGVPSDININQTSEIKNNFIKAEEEKAIPPIVDMEKIIYSPYYFNGITNQISAYTKIQTIKYNLHFYDHNKGTWTDKTTSLDLLGFNKTDIKYQKSSLKKSFIRLSYFDNNIPTNQALVHYSTMFFDTGKMYQQLMINASLDSSNFYTSFTCNDPKLNIDGFSSEGFNLYNYKQDDTNMRPNPLYLKVQFNNALNGKSYLFFNRQPLYGNGISMNNIFINNDTSKQYSYLRPYTIYNKEEKTYIYYFDTINNSQENQNVKYDNGILTIDLFEAKVL